jgi:hypothetical protein
VGKLSVDDWNMLLESDEENSRRGTFERIFPVTNLQKMSAYSKLFECERISNTVLWRWLEAGKNFLENISKKVF